MSLSCGFTIISTLPNYMTSSFVVTVATYDSLVQFLHSQLTSQHPCPKLERFSNKGKRKVSPKLL